MPTQNGSAPPGGNRNGAHEHTQVVDDGRGGGQSSIGLASAPCFCAFGPADTLCSTCLEWSALAAKVTTRRAMWSAYTAKREASHG